MKVLLLGSHISYNLEHYVYMNLKRLGCEVKFCGYKKTLGRLATPMRMAISRSRIIRRVMNSIYLNKINDEVRRLAESYSPDLVLSIKGESITPKTIEWLRRKLAAKAALWYPDDPRFFNSLAEQVAQHYDYVFTASEKAIGMYSRIGVKSVHWLPFGCEPSVHRRIQLSEEDVRKYKCDVCFVGSYTRRRAPIIGALERSGVRVGVWGPYWKLFKYDGNVHQSLNGPEMVKAFNAAKIVLNIHTNEDLRFKANMRTFEAAGSRSFLLTDKPVDLERHFRVGKDVAVYDDETDLVESAKYYMDANEERENMALRAQERAYREHTYQDRLTALLRSIE